VVSLLFDFFFFSLVGFFFFLFGCVFIFRCCVEASDFLVLLGVLVRFAVLVWFSAFLSLSVCVCGWCFFWFVYVV